MTRRSRLKRLEAADLAHPKSVKHSSFNGDVRRKPEDQGATLRRKAMGLTVVDGTNPPFNTIPVDVAGFDSALTNRSRDITGARPVPHGHTFTPAFQRDTDLTDRQKKMLTLKNKGRK